MAFMGAPWSLLPDRAGFGNVMPDLQPRHNRHEPAAYAERFDAYRWRAPRPARRAGQPCFVQRVYRRATAPCQVAAFASKAFSRYPSRREVSDSGPFSSHNVGGTKSRGTKSIMLFGRLLTTLVGGVLLFGVPSLAAAQSSAPKAAPAPQPKNAPKAD